MRQNQAASQYIVLLIKKGKKNVDNIISLFIVLAFNIQTVKEVLSRIEVIPRTYFKSTNFTRFEVLFFSVVFKIFPNFPGLEERGE